MTSVAQHRAEAASGLWRSEDMVRMDLLMQRESVHDAVYFLGLAAKVQFADLLEGVTTFMRPFTNEVRRCEEVERKLRYLAIQLEELDVPVVPLSSDALNLISKSGVLERIETQVEQSDKECRAVNASIESMQRERDFALERSRLAHFAYSIQSYGAETPFGQNGSQSVLAGITDTSTLATVSRIVYRVTRGNSVLRSSDITDVEFTDARDKTTPVKRSCFMVYCVGERTRQKLRKLIEAVGARFHNLDDNSSSNFAGGVENAPLVADDNAIIIQQTHLAKLQLLQKVASTFESNFRYIRLEKAIFSTMNLLLFKGSTCQASVWVPTRSLSIVSEALQDAMISSEGEVASIVTQCATQSHPPTYFETNKYISIFQSIVDSYGVARYKEVNPGVFTIITFPYLFGIMYGDMGHGLLLTLFAGFLILSESRLEGKKLNEIFAMIYGGRYLIFLMGLFATYIGMLYNDFFGFSVGLFPSGYVWPVLPAAGGPSGFVTPVSPNGRPSVKPESPVVFGIDVAWAETENKLEFYNSLKMKCAVIVGVVQMLVGLCMSCLNHIRHKEWTKVYFLFIPELVFLLCTFGYMALLIIIKWCTHYENTHLAPSLLETMTNFFLTPGEVPFELYKGQAGIQVFLLLVAFGMTPFMIFVMPKMEIREKRRLAEQHRRSNILYNNESETRGSKLLSSPDKPFLPNKQGSEYSPTNNYREEQNAEENAEENDSLLGSCAATSAQEYTTVAPAPHDHDNTEIIIHYVIHTIEFVLGTVSNTASYLRLWALSLAHAQLSEVFFTFGLVQVISMDTTGVFTAVASMIWLASTVGVLLGMEALSAFLHSLRLHWVEFQNKFYAGDGKAFEPLDLVAISSSISS